MKKQITLKRGFILFSLLFFTAVQNHVSAQPQVQQNKEGGAVQRNQNVKEIIVVFKTHFDLGYTHRVNDLVQYYRTDMIDRGLKAMESSQSLSPEEQFRWTTPGWVMSKVMEPWKGQTEERRKKLDEAFRKGQFLTHALPFTIESEICEPEVITRGLNFASNLSRRYQLPIPIAAKVTDMPSQAGELATVLANAGVKFLHIGCNWPSGYVQTPGLFWWEGPDGSRLLTFYSSNYGTATGLSYPHKWSKGEKYVGRNLIPPADWPYKVWPAILVTMDNSGPPKHSEVKALFDEVHKMMPGVKVRTGSMDDFVKVFLADNPKVPVFKKEMPDTWVHGAMCDPGGFKLARATAPLLAADELLNTQMKNWGLPVPAIADSIAKAYEKMALYAEHTWGGAASVMEYGIDFKKLPASKFANLEASWEDKTNYVRNAWNISSQIKQDNLKMLAQSVKATPNTAIVYNPLPWARSGLVEINGQQVWAKNIPAGGYKTVPLDGKATLANSNNEFIENQFYKITFNASKGTIQSLVDKRTGHDWAANLSGNQTGAYVNERFTYEQCAKYTSDYQQHRAWELEKKNVDWLHPGINKPGMISEKQVPYRKASPDGGNLKVSVSALQQSATLEMPADTANHLPATKLVVTLTDGQPYLDLEITILNKAKDNWPEADWLALPFNIKNPVFKVYRQLGVMNPAGDIATGANKNLYAVGQGVTITGEGGKGIAVAPLDHPLISLDTTGIWQFSLDFVPKKPIVYVNLYNNQWNTNYRYWYSGSWSSRVRIWSFDGHTLKQDQMAVPALEARNPLEAAMPQNPVGKLPAWQKGITLSRKGIMVTAYGKDNDGNKGTLLRIWEQAGNAGPVTITLPLGGRFSKATPVNLRGQMNGKPISILNGKFSCSIKAFGPASFILN